MSKARPSTPATVLVILAHHDDEFFMAGVLQTLVAAGEQLRVAYLTHGSAYGASSESRINESNEVLTRLGIPPERVSQLGVEHDIFDSHLRLRLEDAASALAALAADEPVKAVYVPAWEGGHPDHDCAHVLGVQLARGLAGRPPVEEVSGYNGCGAPGPLFRVMRFIPADTPVRRWPLSFAKRLALLRFIGLYRSQRRTFLGLLPGILGQLFVTGAFESRPVPAFDYGRPPHSGQLLYEKRFGLRFEDLSRSLRDLERAAALAPH
ncbi:MAG: PIG-L deacetylase family protein [Bacillota bacterium]